MWTPPCFPAIASDFRNQISAPELFVRRFQVETGPINDTCFATSGCEFPDILKRVDLDSAKHPMVQFAAGPVGNRADLGAFRIYTK
jgi:hypothetical protein